ncbi:MAG TPA: dehypoxanthine futalosine cyclase, partial [Desulfosporosinus sp.]|nr:dehypoxanthine futalosine cyclase [Desulfosporosinus sp.]
QCKFCAFYCKPGDPNGYILSRDELHDKIKETIDVGGTQLLIQGGLHPDLDLEYFENLLRDIKSHYSIHIHSFSPPEIWDLANKANLPIEDVILRLKNAGLDSIPGGG